MPRNKKNKGNSAPTPAPNNKAKSPAETKVETPVASVPVAVEVDTSNDDLKLRLANAKERLNLLQEVIGGIGDPKDAENLKAIGIDAAKEKLNIIQDSVDSVKTTLLQVRQETSRSVTPEGSQSGTGKKRKNKKHQNQNPPQGFVVREQPESDESKSKPDVSENEGSAQEDGTSTLSKKKRNRNRNKNKKNQQEQSLASESASQGSVIGDKTEGKNIDDEQSAKETTPKAQPNPQTKETTPKAQPNPQTKETAPQSQPKPQAKENAPQSQPKPQTKETTPQSQPKPQTKETTPQSQPKPQTKETTPQSQPKPQTKENTPQSPPQPKSKEDSPEANKSKNNKKNNKKSQQKSSNEKIESGNTVDAEVKPTDPNKTPSIEVKPTDPNKTPNVEVKPIDLNKSANVEVKQIPQPASNDKNKNKKNKNKNTEGNNNVTEPAEVLDNKSKIQDDRNATETNTDNVATEVSKNKQASNLKKEDSPSQKENQKKSENIKLNVKDQQAKEKNDQKKEQTVEEKTTLNNEKVLPTEIPKTSEADANIKTIAEPPKLDSSKNKKDKKKGQNAENKPSTTKVEEKQSTTKATERSDTITAPKDEAKVIDTQPPKVDAPKAAKDKNQSEVAKSEEKDENNATPIEEKKDSNEVSQLQQSHKNKKNKQHVPKTEEKQVVSLTADSSFGQDEIASKQNVAPLAKEEGKEELKKVTADALLPKSPEKEQVLEVLVPPTVQGDTKTVLDNKTEVLKTQESPKPVVADLTGITETLTATVATPSLPKLDFSQVVKDNKDKIPLMEIKALPVLPIEAVVESRPSTDKLLIDADKVVQDVKIPTTESKPEVKPTLIEDINRISEVVVSKLTSDVISTSAPVAVNKPADETLVAVTIDTKVNTPILTECEAGSSAKQNKAKTPERKGNQVNVKSEQKKPQQCKGQIVKQKQNDPKPSPSNKKEEAKQSEAAKVNTETELVPEKSVPENVGKTEKVAPEKVETKLDDSPAVTPPIEEKKSKEEATKKNENIKKEQVKPKPDEKKLEMKPAAPQNDSKEKEAEPKKIDSSEKQLPVVQDKADKNANKKTVSPVVEAKANVSAEPQKKDSKPGTSSPQQPQKQELKTEMSKKDQKKQNKMKGKAPQPPDIPMDMSLLSASMIDPASYEAISHEESEDQSSLITSDSKNVAGSDFVQSVDSSVKATADATKSLEPIQTTSKNETKVTTEIEREAKSSSPSSNKRNKDMANMKESVAMQETKRQELPEKSAQQKMEPVQFPPVQLIDILEAKMTSPNVKPGTVAGNVRKLPKDTKRTDQLNVQQQKSRSKSPKENIAEKYVKNQQLASGDNKKHATQNLKNEILKTEVGAIVTSVSKEREVKEPTKTVANLNEPKVTSGTASTTAVTETEQVANIKESDAISKQKAETLPKSATISDAKSQPSKDDVKTTIAVGGKNETKPKIAPKPNVPLKAADRSKKSPMKTPENKTPTKESPTKETAVQSKAPAQPKSSPQSKSPAKPPPQAKSQPQVKASSPTTTTVTPSKSEQSAKKPEVPPKPNLPKATPNKVPQTPIVQDEDEEFVEYKFSPRPVFIATACQICKVPLDIPNPCKQCQMVSYCSDEHEKEDQPSHVPLCTAIQEIAKKRGGHIYNNARILNDDDYRSLRVHTLNLCENFLKRHLMPYEREMLLFPRLCCTGSCREWRQQSLVECKQCGQVSYCAAHPEHLPHHHEQWCNSFSLYKKIVLRQKNFGRIEPSLPSKIMLKPFDLSDNIDNVFKILYKNYGSIKDECIYATLTQLATAPLTALYGAQKNQQEIGEVYTIHLVGAELQFEADTLDKWETFFLHLVPTLVECRVVFVGPELNAENLPLEILSRIRMCRTCRQNCRIVKFDFQCGILYHDYVNSSAFTKPDLICFFNPGLYRSTGFNGLDTWPNTIKSATSMDCPIIVTSYTEIESPRDLERIQKESDRPLSVVQSPQINPFASQRPERNFISDEVAPMIFKNFFCFCVK